MKKRIAITLSCAFLLICILSAFFISSNAVNIIVKNNNTDITKGIEQYINRPDGDLKITIKNTSDIDNLKIVLFTTSDNTVGYSLLEKKSNNTYRVGVTTQGTNLYWCQVLKTNKGKYLLFIGGDFKVSVEYVKTELNKQEYLYDISGQNYPIKSYAVPNDTQEDIIGVNAVFLDKNSKKINAGKLFYGN